MQKQVQPKKVLLRERKRHTARRIASTHCAALSPGRGQGEGYLPWMGEGRTYLGQGGKYLGRVYLPWMGLPTFDQGGTYPGQVVPTLNKGYLP